MDPVRRLSLAVLSLVLLTCSWTAAQTTAPASAPTSRPARQTENRALYDSQDPAQPAPRIGSDGQLFRYFAQHHEAFLKRDKQGPIGVLFLGDSITDFWTATNPNRGGKKIWDERFNNEKYQPANFGVSADRTQHVLWRIANGELDDIHPKVVVLMIGTNNFNLPAEDIARGTTAVVNAIRAKLPDTKVLLLAIFPRNEKPDDPVRLKLKAANEILAKLDDNQHVFYLDIADKFLDPDDTLPKTIMPDSLHPNEAGYKIWADAIQPKLDELMK